MQNTQKSYYGALPKRVLSPEETRKLAKRKSESAERFVREVLSEKICQELILELWRGRRDKEISRGPLAESYGSGQPSAADLNKKIDDALFAASETENEERAGHFLSVDLSFQIYVDAAFDPSVPEEAKERLQEVYDDYVEARNELIYFNLRLVPKFAKLFLNRGVPYSDLIQFGNLGLIRAVEKYNPDRGVKISTYSSWWIKRFLSDAVKNHRRTIRVPKHIHDVAEKIAQLKLEFHKKYNRDPEVWEIQAATGLVISKIDMIECSTWELISLESTSAYIDASWEYDQERESLKDNIPDTSPESDPSLQLLRKQVQGVMGKALAPMEEAVLRARFGIDDRPHTLSEVAEELGIKIEKVKNIEALALAKLRRYMS